MTGADREDLSPSSLIYRFKRNRLLGYHPGRMFPIALASVLLSVAPEVTQHDVIPLLYLRCTICHGVRQREAGLSLHDRASMLQGGKSGPALEPGKPDESLILKRTRSGECPPRERLIEASVKPMEPAEIERLARWIALGAPEAPDEVARDLLPHDPPLHRVDLDFWAFRPPLKAEPSDVGHAERVRSPIDAFLFARRKEKGVSFAPEAAREAFIRRASFDLTGLPPEPTEVEDFLADPSPDSHERLVDRLLASPRYGERWGRHWLDLAGYADSEGKREQDLPRRDAWRYRDYVIRSLNADKPYDRFLLEQLAGDELADWERAPVITREIADNLTATGFLRMAPDPTWANITGFVPDRLEVIADEIEILGAAVLGLTFKCARCHDHKFDPISQRDYFRLLAIWKGAFDEHDWLKPAITNFQAPVSADKNGERLLPHVAADERRAWEDENCRIDGEVRAAREKKDEAAAKAIEARRRPEPRIRALWDRGQPGPTHLYRRGDYLNPGPLIEPGLPAFLASGRTLDVRPPWPGARGTGRRLAFARWLVEKDHPLTARVIVNRIWKHHFGAGLVSTLDNLGKAGARPTHPELLDWLAVEFVERGWSLKALHRLLMTSAAYRQSSRVAPESARLDPANALLSRMPLRRLDAEEVHDALLFAAGSLDEASFGPPVAVEKREDGLVAPAGGPVTPAGGARPWRRAIYVAIERKQVFTFLENFDLPLMNPACSARRASTVAPQALQLFNDGWIDVLAARFAARVSAEAGTESEKRVERAFQIALGRTPSAGERDASLAAVERLREEWGKGPDAPRAADRAANRALETFCHALFNSAGFIHVD